MQMESMEDLKVKLVEIDRWEKQQKDLWFWEKLSRLPFKIIDKVTPKFIHDKLGTAIDELGNYIQTGGQYLVNQDQFLKRFDKKTPQQLLTLQDVQSLPLNVMDSVAREIGESRTTIAGIQGATTGIGGIFTLAIDIPVLLGLSLKTLQEIAMCYGYDPDDKQERIFIVKCLQFASSDIVGKQTILEDLETFAQGNNHAHVFSEIQGWREVVTTYRDNFGWKKLFQLVPIAGIIFGALINKSMIQDIAEVGMMLYRKRKIQERLAGQPIT
ncbi:EcsC family protein [Cytobacillus suaedae]|nr:EcsC family protein [Cytobacillus suaedae]